MSDEPFDEINAAFVGLENTVLLNKVSTFDSSEQESKPIAVKCEEEISRRKGKACDMSEILLLLRESGADSTGLDELIDGGFSARVKL